MTATTDSRDASTATGPRPTAEGPSLIDCRGDYPIDSTLASVDDLPSGWYIVNFKDNTWLLYSNAAECKENIRMVGSFANERVLWVDDKSPVTE